MIGPAKWKNIQANLAEKGIFVTLQTLRTWVHRYNLPILRLPNGWPYLTEEMFHEWVVRFNEILKKDEKT